MMSQPRNGEPPSPMWMKGKMRKALCSTPFASPSSGDGGSPLLGGDGSALWGVNHHPSRRASICFPIRMTAAASGPTGRSHLLTTTGKASMHAVASWSAPVLWSFASRRANTEKQWTTKHLRTTTPKAVEDNRTPRRYRDRNTCEPHRGGDHGAPSREARQHMRECAKILPASF